MQSQPISGGRLSRLAKRQCLLGEPDIISIRQVKVSTALFGREKKAEDLQENYINGLIFPTTAHFSSFISSRYKVKDPNKHHIKAKLLMFDAYEQRDVHIEISIPGHMDTRVLSLHGQPLPFSAADYERAYYSSFLRSLYPMNFPSIVLYPLMNRVEILRPVVRNFVLFSFRHQLRELDFELSLFRRRGIDPEPRNLGLEILITFLLENNYSNLLRVVLEELRREKSPRYGELLLEWKLRDKKYGEVVYHTAEKLLIHLHAAAVKEFQLKALFSLEKHSEVVFVGRSLIQTGGTSPEILRLMLLSLVQTGDDLRFLKTLNLVYNLHNPQERQWREVSHLDSNSQLVDLEGYIGKLKCLSQYPDLCFPFDLSFLNRLQACQTQRGLLSKNSKEGFTLSMLQRVEESLSSSAPFFDCLALYVKQRGWNALVKARAESFWLESDFQQQQEDLRHHDHDDDRFSFFDDSFSQSPPPEPNSPELPTEDSKEHRQMSEPDIREDSEQGDFDGRLSEYDCPQGLGQLPRCSARVMNGRKAGKAEQSNGAKVQCNMQLEQCFFVLFNDLKVLNSLESWEEKLTGSDPSTFSKAKRDIAATILIGKGLLHRKLLQNKKSEEALQKARHLAQGVGLRLVANYQLIRLYIDNHNVAGVEFYLVQLLKLFREMGVQVFDIVPEWAKPILQFVQHSEGLSILRNIHPVFKAVFGLYLRSNWTEQEVGDHLRPKK